MVNDHKFAGDFVQMSSSEIKDEFIIIVHNVDIKGQRSLEKDDFDYALDFESIYRPVHGKRTFTRIKE